MPDNKFITIGDNKAQIKRLLDELVLTPRIKALRWSEITKQTPNMKIGYPGQHLASLITGIEGVRTGARGHDLKDGTEVKSCSRIDQLDTCKNKQCKGKVLRIEQLCSHCGSTNIKRMDDSKWLFAVKSKLELEQLTKKVDRILLTIADYPFFDSNDFSTIQFQAFELWNNSSRHKIFKDIMSNYYQKIFLVHIGKNANKTPAPKNFWPYSYQFYLCNPIKVFSCTVKDANTKPSINIDQYIEPTIDRSGLLSEKMPIELLGHGEVKTLLEKVPKDQLLIQMTRDVKFDELQKICNAKKLNKKALINVLPFIDEETRSYLKLRDTDKASEAKNVYSRRMV